MSMIPAQAVAGQHTAMETRVPFTTACTKEVAYRCFNTNGKSMDIDNMRTVSDYVQRIPSSRNCNWHIRWT